MKRMCHGFAGALAAGILIVAVEGAPSVVAAQSVQPSVSWAAWTGCWRPDTPTGAAYGTGPVVCVVPSAAQSAASTAAEVVTIAGDKVTMIDTVMTGVNRTRTVQGCSGPESAVWSADGRRLYLRSRFNCTGGTVRTSAGMFAISPDGKWVNVESVNAGASGSVNVLRYSPTAIPATLPQPFADALRETELATGAARAAAGAPLGATDVIDASRNIDSTVVAAWILDRRQKFQVDASKLIALADAGVPSDVTDAMVAVSYPGAFTLASPGAVASADAGVNRSEPDRAAQRDIRVLMMPEYSPFGYGFTPFGYPYGYEPYGYSPYGYSPYGYSPYGYSPYGYSTYGGSYLPYTGYGGYYGAPVIVLKGSAPAERGYVVKGRGYTQSRPGTQQGMAEPRSTSNAPQPSPSQGNGNNQPAPAPSGRTAHERP